MTPISTCDDELANILREVDAASSSAGARMVMLSTMTLAVLRRMCIEGVTRPELGHDLGVVIIGASERLAELCDLCKSEELSAEDRELVDAVVRSG